ncbi:RdgB/HAM1 family non-canonical purine NTP pyrophosphatase [Agromyces sp. NPDC057679]|uniref:RdgB/HAM1 family non-canonical purine NTP pyrophosphatase n=1 Tax=Agromyces sp. NPDC057679 TaxID=3346207 RepID=UPI00367328BA
MAASGAGQAGALEVVLATHNAHKVAEFQRILGERMPGITVLPYDGPSPVEDGTSFAANALIKARAAAAHTGRIALADDSGIAVDVMGGAPGIFSARWAGHAAGDVENVKLLLAQLGDVRRPNRGAAFHCTIAVVVPAALAGAASAGEPADEEFVAEGLWRGALAYEPRGSHGFGYDPVFEPEGYEVTAAELLPEQKNAISHRARAFEALIPELERIAERVGAAAE